MGIKFLLPKQLINTLTHANKHTLFNKKTDILTIARKSVCIFLFRFFMSFYKNIEHFLMRFACNLILNGRND